MKIALLADLHFGKIAGPDIVPALVRDIREQDFDLVVLAGDLTQRARPREYRAAVQFIKHLPAPVIAVPGNHDVYPWWHLGLRLWFPLRRFHKWITPEGFPSVEMQGVFVLGVNSATGWRVQRGEVDEGTCDRLRTAFRARGSSVRTVLVIHHPPWDDAGQRPLLAPGVLETGPNVVLCGHTHISSVGVRCVAGQLVVAVQSGTATSSRWRDPQMQVNCYQAVTIIDEAVSVEERRFDKDVWVAWKERRSVFVRHEIQGWARGPRLEVGQARY